MDLDPLLLHAEAGDVEALKAELEREGPKRLRCRDPDRRTGDILFAPTRLFVVVKSRFCFGGPDLGRRFGDWTDIEAAALLILHMVVPLSTTLGVCVCGYQYTFGCNS